MQKCTKYSKHDKNRKKWNKQTPENNLPQGLITNNQDETDRTKTLQNQNLSKTHENETEYMGGGMSAIEKEIEVENATANMFKGTELIDLVNKYGDESIIDKENKAIIILGQEKEYLNIIADFFKDGGLKLESNKYGDWNFLKNNSTENSNILDSFNIENEKCLTYKSTYLNNNVSSLEFIIDKFFLQRILSTVPTKFILAIKNIRLSSDLENSIANMFEQFTKLFSNVNISSKSVSIVVTDSPPSNTTKRISEIIDDAVKSGKFSEQQKDIISKIKESIFLLPEASEQAKEYKELLGITSGDYITHDENNKITVNDKYILNSIKIIKNEIEIDVNTLKELVKTKWEKEKDSVFKYKAYPTSDKLQKLVEIIKI